ncbi:ABC transporter ATP-binding protein [Sesbania bispinosa]|nr:ABC transporter ATP-binding protein [Sesbania bispinosa]
MLCGAREPPRWWSHANGSRDAMEEGRRDSGARREGHYDRTTMVRHKAHCGTTARHDHGGGATA